MSGSFRFAKYDVAGEAVDDPSAKSRQIEQDPITGALMAGNVPVLNLQNSGSAQVPAWDLQATVLPRSGTLAALQALTSGGGELCYATDQEAIVQLRGTSPSGTASVYSPMPAGMWDSVNEWLQNPAAVSNLTLRGRDQSTLPGNGVYLFGGDGLGGGPVYLLGGGSDGTNHAGNVEILSGASSVGGVPNGDVRITGNWSFTAQTGGNIYIAPGSGGTLALRRGNNTNVLQIAGNTGALGFFNSAGTTKPTVSGSRGGNAALASLLIALAGLGLLTDSTSA